jgi:hypothetical protein
MVMRLQELERQGLTAGKVGDVDVAGIKQHELMEWYFAHQAERCVAPMLQSKASKIVC